MVEQVVNEGVLRVDCFEPGAAFEENMNVTESKKFFEESTSLGNLFGREFRFLFSEGLFNVFVYGGEIELIFIENSKWSESLHHLTCELVICHLHLKSLSQLTEP